jgi:uncharacterized protein (TIGR02145 family)
MTLKFTPVYLSVFVMAWVTSGCESQDQVDLPLLSTVGVTEITRHTAEGVGIILDDGGSPVLERGVEWGASEKPEEINKAGDSFTTKGTGQLTGQFSVTIDGLSPGTDYFLRAYARNAAGTVYGNMVSFTTMPELDGTTGTVTDFDGNIYRSVFIGGTEWMAENLMVTHYNNGDPVTTDLDDAEWAGMTSGAFAIYPYNHYDGTDPISGKYGALYNWYAIETGNICPTGWKVPDDGDWKKLESYADTMYDDLFSGWDNTGWRGHDAGQRLRAPYDFSLKAYDDIIEPVKGTDDYGFSALPGGFRNFTGPFYDMGNYGYWWSASGSTGTLAWMRSMGYSSHIRRASPDKRHGFSVRCMNDHKHNEES